MKKWLACNPLLQGIVELNNVCMLPCIRLYTAMDIMNRALF